MQQHSACFRTSNSKRVASAYDEICAASIEKSVTTIPERGMTGLLIAKYY